ncbi:MAG: metallophosphoesterase [Pirellulales bacterium]|nr:metallophosphoesterase [Pirellulales bacterium]
MYDLIGDIHGHADELEALLQQLGYRPQDGVYAHPERRVIFLGDFIDRGPQIARVLELAQAMVAAGTALAVLGNHELNALAFHTANRHEPGACLRPHTEKNIHQHCQTLTQLDHAQRTAALDWFRTLPLWLELDGLRVIHACWDDSAQQQVASALADGPLTDEFLHAACSPLGELYEPVETLLKGRELELPDGLQFLDKDGHPRSSIRARWYLPPVGQTYRSYALQADPVACELPLAVNARQANGYPTDAPPVFFGHYWLSAPRPTVLANNVACIDYSVAKGGLLCAYRWQGEQQLRDEHFVWVPAAT